MPRLYFVPGFGGSELVWTQDAPGVAQPSGRVIWGGYGQVVNATNWDLLKIPPPSGNTGRIAARRVATELLAYGDFLEWLQGMVAGWKDGILQPWPYDFRQDAYTLGDNLAQELRKAPPVDGGNYVLAHSYGALVAWVAWARLVEMGATTAVQRITSFGGILHGSHTACTAWAEREEGIDTLALVGSIIRGAALPLTVFGGQYPRLQVARELLEIYTSWPGAYSMLPDFTNADDAQDVNRQGLCYVSGEWAYALVQPQQALMDQARTQLWPWLNQAKFIPPASVYNHIVATGQATPNRILPPAPLSPSQYATATREAGRAAGWRARELLLPTWSSDPDGDARATQAQQQIAGCHVEHVVGVHGELQDNPGVRTLIPLMLTRTETVPQPQPPPPPVPPSQEWLMDGSFTTAINAARRPGATVGQTRPLVVHDP